MVSIAAARLGMLLISPICWLLRANSTFRIGYRVVCICWKAWVSVCVRVITMRP